MTSAPSSLKLGVPPETVSFPRSPGRLASSNRRLRQGCGAVRRERAGVRGTAVHRGSSLPPVRWPTRFCIRPLTLPSHRNWRGSAERYSGRTRSVPGERDSERSDVLKQPDDVYLGDGLQSNPRSKVRQSTKSSFTIRGKTPLWRVSRPRTHCRRRSRNRPGRETCRSAVSAGSGDPRAGSSANHEKAFSGNSRPHLAPRDGERT